jgi:hypothetical protein
MRNFALKAMPSDVHAPRPPPHPFVSGPCRPAGLDVLDDGREVGRIYEDRSESTPPDLRWFWSVTVYVPPSLGVRTSDRAATFEQGQPKRLAIFFCV